VGHKVLKLRTYHSCDGMGPFKSQKKMTVGIHCLAASNHHFEKLSICFIPSFQILHPFHSRQQRHPHQTLATTTVCKTFWVLFAAPWFSDPGATMLPLPESPTSLAPLFENRESHSNLLLLPSGGARAS